MRITLRTFLCLVIFTGFTFAQSDDNESCLECHGEEGITRTTETGDEESIFVDMIKYGQSSHGEFDCIDCHTDAVGDPHPEQLADVACGECHDDATENYVQGIHGKERLSGDLDAPSCSDCHGKHDIRSSLDEGSMTYAVNLPNTCGNCHKKDGVSATHDIPISEPYEKFEQGIHGQLLAEGTETAATCASCHESHGLLPLSDPRSTIFRTNISTTCGQCHSDLQEEFDNSIHGKAVAMGVTDAPTCIDCHGEHKIIPPESPDAPTYPLRVSEETCSPCHGLLRLSERYGILADRVSTYMQSYHGLARHKGTKVAANCVSCHGVHNILSATDPQSTIHPANLKETCGTCHPNATQTFAESYIHATAPLLGDKIASIIKRIYVYLIVLVIGGMVIHNLLIWFGYVRSKYRELKTTDTICRFNKPWIIQHLLLLTSFTILVISGFALKFAGTPWIEWLQQIGFSEAVRRIVHRSAGVVLMALGAVHVLRFILYRSTRKEIGNLVPDVHDVNNFLANMKYSLGISKIKPMFKRYSYTEKAEYWAVAWGTVVMGITGLVLWFPVLATKYFPAWIVKVSETLHYYEAILATLAILLYHMFYAIFHPEDYPLNLTFLTGKLTKEEVEHRYPAWYKQIKEKDSEKR